MPTNYDLIVRGGTVVNHAGIARADIAILDGRIAGIRDFALAEADAVIDATGLHILPGVIDTQVHFREPGDEHKEDLESGTRAAVLGGVTAVFEMPNTAPPTTNRKAIEDKLKRASDRAWCDHAFYVGADGRNTEQLRALERLPGVCGVKLFMGSSTGTLLVAEDADIGRVLESGVRRVAVHAEDEARLVARRGIALDLGEVRAHPIWRDERTALGAVQRLMALARAASRRVHVLPVTTAEEIAFLARFKDLATVEVTPQHLTLAAPDCYQRLGTRAQMNPPIRNAAHREGLWRGVREGVVDVLGSDHAPHTLDEKATPYPDSPSGMPGVQTLVPVMLDHVHAGKLSLLRLVDLVCTGPARIFGIAAKGRMAVGYDGDLTIVDLQARREITDAWIASRCGWTPFAGATVTGWPVATVIRGRVMMRDDEVLGTPAGEPVRFHDGSR
jgi:dihydroorotase